MRAGTRPSSVFSKSPGLYGLTELGRSYLGSK